MGYGIIELTQLRRIHAIDRGRLEALKQHLDAGGEIDPVTIVRYPLPTGATVWIVSDGMHRTQASLELGRTEIACYEENLGTVRSVARNRGVDFDDLAHRAVPFRDGQHGMGR